MPGTRLTANGRVVPSTGSAHTPANQPLHGSGLFFAGPERDGSPYVGFREADRSDDGVHGFDSGTSSHGHALHSGTFPCRSRRPRETAHPRGRLPGRCPCTT
ncbi:hypothetical protein ACWC3X_40570 [Streptomyces populi]